MKAILLLVACIGCFAACDQFEEDVVPVSFGGDLKIHPDNLYVYNNKTSRVHSEANDTIVSFDKKTYSTPINGTLVANFDGIEGTMGYRPNPGFVGTDSLTYQVCSGQTCKTAKIKLIVEEPVDPANCTTTIQPDFVKTKRDKPVEIRMFVNDIICPSPSVAAYYNAPSRGTVRYVNYFEGWKNDVWIYTPAKGFVGVDSFTYKFYPNGYTGSSTDKYLEAEVRITVE
ncbi:Ig-like domain-containing protein [Pontibacter cellulosilyticus]|uniref:Uncharacterized protein n=1 Tax=Pontibacter cellulosilyticus TaxID=1720253 RepID=A0A923NCS6_9BACT|nr:Ig-like domain-containing protein [Pontibacter cellulosilyticus]MBC5994565.1 hypothetical protein [Pontibacter cellulosilyticus]